jgi:hypothetical protein
MKQYFGWVQSSDMAGVYVHLSGRDIDTAILGTHNLKKEIVKEDQPSKLPACGRCNFTNLLGSKFCSHCGNGLNSEVVIRTDENSVKPSNLMDVLMQDNQFKELLLKKLLENNSRVIV